MKIGFGKKLFNRDIRTCRIGHELMCKFMETLYAVMLSHADFVPLDMLGKDIINSLSYGSFIKVIKRYLLFSLRDASAGNLKTGMESMQISSTFSPFAICTASSTAL